MENSDSLADLSARLRRIEEAVSGIAAALASLAQAHDRGTREILCSQVAYLGDRRALTLLQSGLKIFVDTRSVDIGSHLMFGGQWEADYAAAFASLLKPGDKVLDIGANHGFYSLLAAQKVGPSGHVHAFEPSSSFCELISASVSVNGFDRRVTVVNRAVADREFESTLLADARWSGGGHLVGDGADATQAASHLLREAVRCIRLDEYFSDPAATIDVVKMDIEGAEGLALKGMTGLIERSPTLRMMIEFAPEMLASFACDATYVRRFLESRNFRCWTIRPDGSLVPEDWDALLASPRTLQNIVVSRQDPG